MSNKRMENSIKSLVELYTVVIGVALSLAVANSIETSKGLDTFTPPLTFLFIAFIVTLFPFYHGALRHLDDAYLENNNRNIKDGALIIDFVLLFLHALVFVVLSFLLKKPTHFIWVLTILLAIDVVWGIFAHFASSSDSGLTPESRWTIINLLFVGASTWYLVANDIYLQDLEEPIKLAFPILLVCIARTLVDYIWCKDIYFPK